MLVGGGTTMYISLLVSSGSPYERGRHLAGGVTVTTSSSSSAPAAGAAEAGPVLVRGCGDGKVAWLGCYALSLYTVLVVVAIKDGEQQ